MSPLRTKYDDKASGGGCQGQNTPAPLRVYRIIRGITQDELARLSGVDRATISRAENGYRDLTEDQKARIVEALDAPIETLFK